MKFEKGKFYCHEAGRAIAILSEVETYKWGKQLVVEETDPTGHGISTMNFESKFTDAWIEIGKPEWDRRFKEIHSCAANCGVGLVPGEKVMKTDDGKFYHEDCWKKIVGEGE